MSDASQKEDQRRRPISCIVLHKLWVIYNMFLHASGVNFFFFFIIKPSRGFVATFCEAVLVFVSRNTSEIFEYSPTDKKIFSRIPLLRKWKIWLCFAILLNIPISYEYIRPYHVFDCVLLLYWCVVTKYTILTKLLVDCVSWTWSENMRTVPSGFLWKRRGKVRKKLVRQTLLPVVDMHGIPSHRK